MAPEDIVLLVLVLLPVLLGGLAWRTIARLHRRAREPTLVAKLLLATIAGALSAATILLGLEIHLRFLHDATDAFGLLKTSQRWFDRHYQRNSWHLRDDVDYTLERLPGRRRVTFVGDSFTAGHGVRDVGERFANRIRRARPDWDVQVLARNGLDTGAEIHALLAAFADGYQTDDLVLVYCPNDLGDLLPDWRRVVDGLYADFRDAGPLVHHSYAANYLYFRLLAKQRPQLGGYYPRLAAAYEGPTWTAQAKRLRSLVRMVRGRDVRFFAVTFPFLTTLGPDDPFAPAYDRLGRLWHSLDVPHLDLRPALAATPTDDLVVNAYDPHPSTHAHALAAAAIARFLDEVAAPAHPDRSRGPVTRALVP